MRTALLGELILEIHRDMMEEAKAKGKEHLPTFCVITHDIMSARRVADYINVLWKGRIVEAGPAEDMLNSENPFIRQFLSGESQGPLVDGLMTATAPASPPDLVEPADGRSVRAARSRRDQAGGDARRSCSRSPLGGGALALRLQPNTSSDTFVNSSSPEYKASLDDNATSAATRW